MAELQPVSQETLEFLLEEIRSRCPTHILASGSGGISFKGAAQDDRSIGVDLYYYGDNDAPTVHNVDESLRQDESGRYELLPSGLYKDIGVRATIFKTEEFEPRGKKLVTIYKIIKNKQELAIDKRVHPLELPLIVKIGERLLVDEDCPPLITNQERQASRRQEDELGLSSVSESEANSLIELLRPV